MIGNYYFLPDEYLHFVDDWMVFNPQCNPFQTDGNSNESRNYNVNEKTITVQTHAQAEPLENPKSKYEEDLPPKIYIKSKFNRTSHFPRPWRLSAGKKLISILPHRRVVASSLLRAASTIQPSGKNESERVHFESD